MNTSHEQEASKIYVTYVRTACSSSEKEASSHGRCFAPHSAIISPKAWPVWRGHKSTRGRREGRPSHAVEGWQRADATSMTPPSALLTTAACEASALCVIFFGGGQRKTVVVLWPLGRVTAPHTPHSTPHASTAQRAPVQSPCLSFRSSCFFLCGGRRNNRERHKLTGPARLVGYSSILSKPTPSRRKA